MIPAKFEYIKASSVSEALALLDKHGDDAQLIAGGHSLVPAMKLRLNQPGTVIDIGKIPGLNSIKEDGDDLVIGANCTHHQIATSPIVKQKLNVLAQTAKSIGDIQVRNKGTIGGSLAHADPAADYPAVILASDAKIEVEGINGKRSISGSDFFQGIYATALGSHEMIIAIRIPKASNGVYLKFSHPASRFAVVGCAAIKNGAGISIGLTGVADHAYRASAVERAYDGDAKAASEHAVDGVAVMSDNFASSEYRSHLAKVFTERALSALG
ncbi:MAG: xanthine dehydrogenase family protein subunit M [Bacteroidetes bacterium]|nr:xanthine dehydrogenase family protein subunit M [Bacteroidota bacterium]MDA1121351.1 xanthine dehydrogenase family protein subunit M [Bacteroidota bacterium]